MVLYIPSGYPDVICPGTRIEGGKPRWDFGMSFNTQRLQRLYQEAIRVFRVLDLKDILRFFTASTSGAKAQLIERIRLIEESLATRHPTRGVRELYLTVLNHPRSAGVRAQAEDAAARSAGAAAATTTAAAARPGVATSAPARSVRAMMEESVRLAVAMGMPSVASTAMAYGNGADWAREYFRELTPHENRLREATISASLSDADEVLRGLDPFTKVLGRLAAPFRFVPLKQPRHAFRLSMEPATVRDLRAGKLYIEVRCYALFPSVRAVCWPKDCRVLVNGKPSCPTSQRTSGWDRPPIVPESSLQITGLVYTGVPNTVEVQSLPEPGVFVFGVYGVVPMPLGELAARIQRENTRSKEVAREWTKERLGGGGGGPGADEVEISGPMTVDLRCPITLARPEAPARSSACRHLTCFELEALLEVMKRAADKRPRCPLCSERLHVGDLYVDGFINEVLHDPATQGAEKVDFLPDCTWKLPDPSSPARPSSSPQRSASARSRGQVMDLDVDPTEPTPDATAARSQSPRPSAVIELLDSSDDEGPGEGSAGTGTGAGMGVAAAAAERGRGNGRAASSDASHAPRVVATSNFEHPVATRETSAGPGNGGAAAAAAAAPSAVPRDAAGAGGGGGSQDPHSEPEAPSPSPPQQQSPDVPASIEAGLEDPRRDWTPAPPSPDPGQGPDERGRVLGGPSGVSRPSRSPALVGQSPSPQPPSHSGAVSPAFPDPGSEEQEDSLDGYISPQPMEYSERGGAGGTANAAAAEAAAGHGNAARASRSVDPPNDSQRDADVATSGADRERAAAATAAPAVASTGERGGGSESAGSAPAAVDDAFRVLKEAVLSETGSTSQAQVALSDALRRAGVQFDPAALETALAIFSSRRPGTSLEEEEWAAIHRTRAPLLYRFATQYFAGGDDAEETDEEAPPAKRSRSLQQ